MAIIGYDEARNYTDEQLRAMGFSPVQGVGWMDNSTAMGLGAPATMFGTGGIIQMEGLQSVDNLNRLASANSTYQFNRDYSPGGAFYNDPAAIPAITTTPTETQKTDSEGGVWNLVKDAATGVGNWVKDNAGSIIGGTAGLVATGSPAGAALGANIGNIAQDYFTPANTEPITSTLNNYGLGGNAGSYLPDPSVTSGVNTDNSFANTLDFNNLNLTPTGGTLATVDQMNTWMDTDPYADIDFGLNKTSTGDYFNTRTISGMSLDFNGNDNINTSDLDFLNSTGTITPSYGNDLSITGDIAKNISNSMNIPNTTIGGNLNTDYSLNETDMAKEYTPAVGGLPKLDASTLDFGLKKNADGSYFNTDIINNAGLSPSGTSMTGAGMNKLTVTDPYGEIDTGVISDAIRNSPVTSYNSGQLNQNVNSLPPPSNPSPSPVVDPVVLPQTYTPSSGLPDNYRLAGNGNTGENGTLPTIDPVVLPQTYTPSSGLPDNYSLAGNGNTGENGTLPTIDPVVLPQTYTPSSGLPDNYSLAGNGNTGENGTLPTITPGAVSDYTLRTSPFTENNSLTSSANVSPGDLPQFRRGLNRALSDANNAAIMAGRPLSRDSITGAVEGLAEGASGRMNAANQLALQNRQIESSELQQARGLRSEEQRQAEDLGLRKWETQSNLSQDLAIEQSKLQETQRQFNSQLAENKRQFDNGEINRFEYQRREQELRQWETQSTLAQDLAIQQARLQESQREFNSQLAENQRQFDNGEINRFEYQRREQELRQWETQSTLAQDLAIQQARLQESQREFDAQLAENQRQFDNGEINRFEYQRREQELTKWRDEQINAFNEKQLEMQKYYADQGLELDMDMIKQNNDNANMGNILGASYLISKLYWG